MSTNAIEANYKPAYYAEAKNIVSASNNNEEDVSIYTSDDKTTSDNAVNLDYACTDGKDDGKLGTGEVIESVGKGILKSGVNMITAPFKEAAKGNFLPIIGVVAGAALMATPIGAPLAVIGGVLGIAKGAGDIVGGVVKANEIANSGTGTDGEAKTALEQVGSGVLTTGLSAIAVAGGVKTIKGRANAFAAKDGTKMNDIANRMKAGEKVGFTEKVKAYTSDSLEGTKFGKLTSKTTKTEAQPEAQATPDASAEISSSNPTGKAETKVEVRYNADKVQPTNKNLTVEQAQADLDAAQAMLQDGVDSRTLTKADYKAAQQLVKESQANLDYAKAAEASRPQLQSDLASQLEQIAKQKGATVQVEQPATNPIQPKTVANPTPKTGNITTLKQNLDTIVNQGKTYGFSADVPQNSSAYTDWLSEYNNALSKYNAAAMQANSGTYTPTMTPTKATFTNAQQAALNLNPDSVTVTDSGLWIVPSFSY